MTETNEKQVTQLVRYLGENIEQRKDSAATLRALAASTESVKVKRAIYEYVAPAE